MDLATELTFSVANSDPAIRLRAVAALRRLADQLEALQVQRSRQLGWSWTRIAAALGVSKQAVHQKHGPRSAHARRPERNN